MKLFAMEEDSGDNELLIDKLLDKKKEEESPLSLTANLLKKRDQISKDVKDHIEKTEEEGTEGDSSQDSEGTEEPVDKKEPVDKEESTEKPKEESTEESTGTEEETKEEPKEDSKEDSKEDDEGAAADSEEDLEALIGSEGGDKKPATESLKVGNSYKKKVVVPNKKPVATLTNWNRPILESYSRYKLSLESIDPKATPVEEKEQPVVYVKDSVLESINNLTSLAFKYIDSNKTFIAKSSEVANKLTERLAVFTELVKAVRYNFTHKLIEDRDILSNICYKDESDLRDTSRSLSNYIKTSNSIASILSNNSFEQLRSSFLSSSFEQDKEESKDLIYSKPIPGFNEVRVSSVPYVNYLKTKLEDYHYFNLKTIKTEDLYDLSSISITEDKDMLYITEALNGLVRNLAISIDTLKGITDNFEKLVEQVKVIAYDVEKDQFKKLTDLNLDDKIKDFIRFKLIMEISYINIKLIESYVLSTFSALNIAVELKE